MEAEDYKEERVKKQQLYFSAKSSSCKAKFLFFRTSVIILASSIPFLSAFISDQNSEVKYLIAFIGSLIAVFEGILSLFKYQEQWLKYRQTSERLKRELFLFDTKTKPYDNDDFKKVLVTRVEFILEQENEAWIKQKEEN